MIPLKDIYKRARMKNYSSNVKSQFNINNIALYTNNGAFNENNAFYIINHWTGLNENTNIAYDKALDVFSEICENCNDNKINEACDILLQEINKVRDATQLQNSIKHKTSRLKTKIITKIQNKIDDASDGLSNAIYNVQSKLKPSLPSTTPSTKNGDTVAEECFNKLYNESAVLIECDRILNNYSKVCKRFDIDKIISELASEDSLNESINEICACIDTYNIPFINKYNSSLETCSYAFQKNYIKCPPKKIVEAVTDYYIFNTRIESFDDISKISKISPIFNESDFDSVSFLYNKKINENTIRVESPEYGITSINEDINDVKITGRVIRDDISQWKYGNPQEHANDDVKEMINDFRIKCAKLDKDDNKNALLSQFKALLTKLFTKNSDQIVNELPKMLTLVRMTFIISSCAINPVIGLITFITDRVIKLTLSRKETERIINAYKKELDSVDSKLNKTKDAYTKDRLERYKKELKKDLEKIKDYERNLYSDEENDKRDKDDNTSYEFDDDFDFDFDEDDDFGLSESQLINCATIKIISELMQSIQESNIDNVDEMVANNIYKLSNDTIDTITDFSITVPTVLEKNKLCEVFKNYRKQLREAENKDYMRIDAINENIYKIENSNSVYNTNMDSKSIICSLMWLSELAMINNNSGYVNEMNITNTLKLALNRLKNTAMKLSDKEKQMSNTIDTSVNNMSKGIEKAMMNDSRESIIRGSILPSASKTIKMALILGAEWAVNPAIAVITALGAFACQKRLSAKERQLALDDIEIELKMCERYMRQAEDKNDMKAIRNIEQIQRNLERQQQRIKYRMKVVYNQDVPNAPGNDN